MDWSRLGLGRPEGTAAAFVSLSSSRTPSRGKANISPYRAQTSIRNDSNSMARDPDSPYPPNAVFGVHKGFKPGAYTEYKAFLAQTAGYPGGKEVWAVFTDIQHAAEYSRTGIRPVTPIAEKRPGGVVTSSANLPTPDQSPETENPPPGLPTRQRLTASAHLTVSASQPPPAPRKLPTVQPDWDNEGDTEPEEEYKPASSSLPAQRMAKTPQNAIPRRPYKSGSITEVLQRHASMNGGFIRGAQTPSPTKNLAPASGPVPPSTAPAALGTVTNRHARDSLTASGSGLRTAPHVQTLAPFPASTIVPSSTPISALAPAPVRVPALVPELPLQPRPHGTYEQCHHCDGKGWVFSPAQPHAPPPQPSFTQTPSGPRATPTTNLRILSTSDSDSASGSAASRIRTPSGSRLRLSSIGGVGPERTPKRNQKRAVSDSVTARQIRIASDGSKDKGKGKERAVEPMDIDAPGSQAGPSTYNYIIYVLIIAALAQYDKLFKLFVVICRYAF
ncbi:hypothetical protein OPQ81_008130 [Rhizoctonia solani]|nr:hypothetical protein OPQ81_008130 [Rhizoctonia solani]